MSQSVDDTIQRILTNLEQFKLQRQRERSRRERLKCLHLVLAVLTILLVASLGVGLRVSSEHVFEAASTNSFCTDSDVN